MTNQSPESSFGSREVALLGWIHDYAPYGVLTTDKQFRIRSWNHWMELHSGKELSTVLGMSIFDLFPDLTERGLAPRLHRALEGEVSVLSTALHGHLLSFPSSVRDPAFSRMKQTARIAPLRDEAEILGTIITIEDVSEREYQAFVLKRQHGRDKILAWALAYLLESREPRRIVRDLFFKLAEHFDLDAYLLYLGDAHSGALKLQAAGGVVAEEERRLSLLDAESGPGGFLLNVREPTALEGPEEINSGEPAFKRLFGFRACALIPLVSAETRFGTLCFGTRTRDAFQDGELELFSTIGQYLAIALSKESANLQLHAAQAKLNRHALELENQVNERTARLREIITELETFSYTLAHDLRAPIRALTGYCEVLIEDYSSVLSGDARDIVGKLHSACHRLDLLTKDLLAFSRVSRQSVELAPVDVDALVTEVLSLTDAHAGAVIVRRPLHPVLGQRMLLQQCLSNLIDNARKFVPSGQSPKVRIWTEIVPNGQQPVMGTYQPPFSPARQLEETSGIADPAKQLNVVRIVVEDEGIGIAKEAHAKVFGIFERGTSSPDFPGSGIGLAIVARAMQRMGGRCGVDSELGKGSRFWLELAGT
jgi:signal transduction histidine kinase